MLCEKTQVVDQSLYGGERCGSLEGHSSQVGEVEHSQVVYLFEVPAVNTGKLLHLNLQLEIERMKHRPHITSHSHRPKRAANKIKSTDFKVRAEKAYLSSIL